MNFGRTPGQAIAPHPTRRRTACFWDVHHAQAAANMRCPNWQGKWLLYDKQTGSSQCSRFPHGHGPMITLWCQQPETLDSPSRTFESDDLASKLGPPGPQKRKASRSCGHHSLPAWRLFLHREKHLQQSPQLWICVSQATLTSAALQAGRLTPSASAPARAIPERFRVRTAPGFKT